MEQSPSIFVLLFLTNEKDVAQNKFVKDLVLYVVKGYMPISTMENNCLRLFSVVIEFSCGVYFVF